MKGKKVSWQLLFAALLVILSAILYWFHYLFFHDSHHIFIYMVGDIAFVPIEVLLVTLIIHRLLEAQQKQSMMKKLNMVIGSFFSEVGTDLLQLMTGFCENDTAVSSQLLVTPQWKSRDYSTVVKKMKTASVTMNAFKKPPGQLKEFLHEKRGFLLDLLSNPNLLEPEKFTDLMWALLHLSEELQHRKSLDDLPDSDKQHLSGDMKRVYFLLTVQWLNYMEHLQTDYPYLFSLAARTNPFNPAASVVVK